MHHPLAPAEVGARDHRVAAAGHRQVREGAQRRLHCVGDLLLVVGDRLDVDELLGEGDDVGGEIELHAVHTTSRLVRSTRVIGSTARREDRRARHGGTTWRDSSSTSSSLVVREPGGRCARRAARRRRADLAAGHQPLRRPVGGRGLGPDTGGRRRLRRQRHRAVVPLRRRPVRRAGLHATRRWHLERARWTSRRAGPSSTRSSPSTRPATSRRSGGAATPTAASSRPPPGPSAVRGPPPSTSPSTRPSTTASRPTSRRSPSTPPASSPPPGPASRPTGTPSRPPPASTDGTWTTPVDLSVPGQSARTTDLAVDPAGNATAIWVSGAVVQAADPARGWDLGGPGRPLHHRGAARQPPDRGRPDRHRYCGLGQLQRRHLRRPDRHPARPAARGPPPSTSRPGRTPSTLRSSPSTARAPPPRSGSATTAPAGSSRPPPAPREAAGPPPSGLSATDRDGWDPQVAVDPARQRDRHLVALGRQRQRQRQQADGPGSAAPRRRQLVRARRPHRRRRRVEPPDRLRPVRQRHHGVVP